MGSRVPVGCGRLMYGESVPLTAASLCEFPEAGWVSCVCILRLGNTPWKVKKKVGKYVT
jgi:hypothetical protein